MMESSELSGILLFGRYIFAIRRVYIVIRRVYFCPSGGIFLSFGQYIFAFRNVYFYPRYLT